MRRIYNCENVTELQMVEACGIHIFIKALPNGYDAVLDDNTSVSAGQKQLFTIARAMILGGLLPAKKAAKKAPVIALRTE